MDISVVVCTRNRAVQLSETLSSFTKLGIPSGTTWEVVVVDNGSTDSTAEVIHSFEGALPIRRVFQALAGISNARNAGAEAAQGKYLICTDDDVQVAPNWVVAFLDAFRRWPDAVVFGGKITPSYKEPTPDWFRDAVGDLQIMYGARDFGPDPVPLSIANDRIPYGACYAIRATEQRQFRFDPALGRAPGRQRGGEETAVVEAILKANHSGWWVPNAEVRHIIPPSMQTLEYIVRFYEGTGDEWAHLTSKDWRWTFFRVPFIVWAKLPVAILRLRLAYMTQSKSWPHYLGRLAWYRGVFKYCFHEWPLEKWLVP
jgi:glucosyl-dolichyl phosphate glucuronosyltransferase